MKKWSNIFKYYKLSDPIYYNDNLQNDIKMKRFDTIID